MKFASVKFDVLCRAEVKWFGCRRATVRTFTKTRRGSLSAKFRPAALVAKKPPVLERR
jgi:hypothetical protein